MKIVFIGDVVAEPPPRVSRGQTAGSRHSSSRMYARGVWRDLRGTFREMGLYTLAVVVLLLAAHLFRVGSSEFTSALSYGWIGLSVQFCRRVGLRKPWWLDTVCWLVFSFALMWLSLSLFQYLEPKAMQEMGPGGITFLFPMGILFFGIPINGILNRNKHLLQHPKPV